MIPIAHLEKFGRHTNSPFGEVWSSNIISSVEVRNMIANSSKPNKLQNVYIIRSTARNVTSEKLKIYLNQNQSHRAYHKFKKKQINLQ